MISIHAPRAGSDAYWGNDDPFNGISIHAPRAGGDRKRGFDVFAGYKFQSTLPVRGATIKISGHRPIASRFQSTLPVRGATGSQRSGLPKRKDFNPRSPCGERHGFAVFLDGSAQFQSTLPVRGATNEDAPVVEKKEFQSTLPVRGATLKRYH